MLEDALKTSKNVGKKKKQKKKQKKNSGHFLWLPIEDMPHFVLFCFVVVNRAIKSNYRVINEKLSRDKWKIIARQMGNLLGRTWWAVAHVVSVDDNDCDSLGGMIWGH